MQFVKCSSCGKRYSDDETNCPFCGAFNIKGQTQWELSEEETDEGQVFETPNPKKLKAEKRTAVIATIFIIAIVFITLLPMLLLIQVKSFQVPSVKEPEQVYVCPNGFVLEDGRCVQIIEEETPEYLQVCGFWELGHIYNPENDEQVSLEEAEISFLDLFDDNTGYMYKNSEMEEIYWEYGEFDDVYSIYADDTLKALAFLDPSSEVLTIQFLNSDNVLLLFR